MLPPHPERNANLTVTTIVFNSKHGFAEIMRATKFNEHVVQGALSAYKYFDRNTIRYHSARSNVQDRSTKLDEFTVKNGIEII